MVTMYRSARLCLLALSAISLSSPQVTGSDQLRDDACNNHQTTVESIRTFHCQASVTFSPAQPWGANTGEYWRVGNNFRCRAWAGRAETHYSSRDGVTKLYTADTSLPGEKGRDGRVSDKDMAYSCDVWSYGLLSFYGKDRFRVSLKELLAGDGITVSARQAEKSGRRLVRVDISHSRADLEIWLDPTVNYLARHVKTTTKPPHGMLEAEATVETFQEVTPGVFFPIKVRCEMFAGKDRQKSGWSAEFSAVEINPALADKILDVRFPPNLLVSDDIRNGMFRTNAEGEPILMAVNSQGKQMTLVTNPPVPTASPDTTVAPASVTQEEPQSQSRWILPVALTLLVAAVVLTVVRRVRTRHADRDAKAH